MHRPAGTKKAAGRLFVFIKPHAAMLVLAVVFVVAATVLNALAPRTEGLIITQLTNDALAMARGG